MADSLDRSKVFSQSRYEDGGGDYLNAPFGEEEYERFMEELVAADRVIKREFETADLFQACQPIEEIARRGFDAPRFGLLASPIRQRVAALGRWFNCVPKMPTDRASIWSASRPTSRFPSKSAYSA